MLANFQYIAYNKGKEGAYAIVDVNGLDRLKATVQLLTKLEEGERSTREQGWLFADEAEAELGV